MRRRREFIVACAVISAARPLFAQAVDYHIERVTPNFINQPTFLTQAPGDPANIVYYSTRIPSFGTGGFGATNPMGSIYRLDLNTGISTDVYDVTNSDGTTRNLTGDEGLVGFAFNPDFNNSASPGYGKIYVSNAQMNNPPISRVEEFKILNSSGGIDTSANILATQRLILQYSNANNNQNHTIDWIGFDPTATGAARDYLYVSTGDGAFGNAYNNASGTTGRPSQNPSDLKGKILRLDISGGDDYDGTHTINSVLLPNDPNKNFAIPSTNPIPTYVATHLGSIAGPGGSAPLNEVFATGIRNGYRMSFDRATGDMYFGDVGENNWESIDTLKAGSNTGVAPPIDFGFPQNEANHDSAISGAPHTTINPWTGATVQNPLQEWSHSIGQAAIGGYVYNGPIASLKGKYIFADFVSGNIYTLDYDRNTDPSTFNGHTGTLTDMTVLWQSLVKDPNNVNYNPNITPGNTNPGNPNGIDHVVSFGEDNAGNVYIIDFSAGLGFNNEYNSNQGEIFKLVPGAPAAAPALAVWSGAINSNWNDDGNNATTPTNFNDLSGNDINALPGLATDVVFKTVAGTTTLGRDMFINSLTLRSTSPALIIQNGSFGASTLVINGSSGITVEASSGGLTINTNVWLGANQTWTNNAASDITINGTISGVGGLTILGKVTFGTSCGGNYYQGGTFLPTGGTLTITGTSSSLVGNVVLNGGMLISTASNIPLGNANNGPLGNFASAITVNSGIVSTTGEIWVGTNVNGYGGLVLNAGTVTVGSWLAVARTFNNGVGSGVLNVNGGVLNVNNNPLTVGSSGAGTALHAQANFTSGVSNIARNLFVGELSSAIVTISGDAQVIVNGTTSFGTSVGVAFGRDSTAANVFGILNLDGGTLTTTRVMKANGTTAGTSGTINFNGGTLKANTSPAANPVFVTGPSSLSAFVYSNGATIDDSGMALTVDTPLQAPTGNGVSAISLPVVTNYFGPPLIAITSGGGAGATAVANIDTNGNLTGITVTNPGRGYTSNPTITLSDPSGLFAPTQTSSTTITLTPVSAGGLTKKGTGTVVLTGVATFGGNVSIAAGQLTFDTNSSSSSIIGAVSGGGRLLVNTNAVVTSNGVSIADTWTINGKQIINTGVGNIGTSKVFAVPVIAHSGSGTSAVYTGLLQLADSRLIVQSNGIPADKTNKINSINEAITAGSNGAVWNGNGITSSTAQGDPTHLGVGVFDNGILNKTSFGGQSVDTNSIFVAVAHLGDTNRDNIVNIQDISIVANNWQMSRNNWTQGDLNRDGIVNIQDFSIVANNWQQTSNFSENASVLGMPSGVPEPASLLVLSSLVPLLLRRRMPRDRRSSGKSHDT